MSEAPKYLRTRAAATYVGCSPRTLEKLRITGGGPAFLRPTARCVVYAVEDLEAWIQRDRRRSTSDSAGGRGVIVSWDDLPLCLQDIAGLLDISAEAVRVGVYFLVREGEVQYIGQSTNVAARVSCHRGKIDFDSVFVLECAVKDLDRTEGSLIRAMRPRMNGQTLTGNMRAPIGNIERDRALIASVRALP